MGLSAIIMTVFILVYKENVLISSMIKIIIMNLMKLIVFSKNLLMHGRMGKDIKIVFMDQLI